MIDIMLICIVILEMIIVVVVGLWCAITAPKEYNWQKPGLVKNKESELAG